jgi:CDP-diacylglycerol--serine O-phosphatidyltransferase
MFGALNDIRAADIVTAFNALFGFLGIYFVFSDLQLSALFLFVSVIMDGIDGAISRIELSLLGEDLDSLADMISFGVLPSLMLIAISDSWIYYSIGGLFLITGMIRLARFNILKIKDEFVGYPITASALFIGSLVYLEIANYIIAIVALVLSFFMISNLRYQKIRDKILLTFTGVVLISAFFIKDSAYIVAGLTLVYLVSPFPAEVSRWLERKKGERLLSRLG